MATIADLPILLLIGSAASQTRCMIEALAAVKPTRLFIAADGPDLAYSGEAEHYQSARNQLELIDWPCEFQLLFPPVHRGRNAFIPQAVSWFFEHVEEGVIIEDCCAPAPDFFPFAAQMLDYYRAAQNVAQICGSNPAAIRERPKGSHYFSNYGFLLAWASWRRAWSAFQSFSVKPSTALLQQIAQSSEEFEYWQTVFAAEPRLLSWEVRWNYFIWESSAFSVVPRSNLVRHLDFRVVLENFPVQRLLQLPTEPMIDIVCPETIMRDCETDKQIFSDYFSSSANSRYQSSIREAVQEAQIELTEAIEEAEAVPSRVDNSLQIHGLYERALSLKCSSHFEEAVLTLDYLLESQPDHAQAAALRAEIRALDLAASSLNKPAESPTLPPPPAQQEGEEAQINRLIDRALEAMEREDNSAARTLLDQALVMNVIIRDLKHAHAMCLIKFDRLLEAKDALAAELERYPDNTPARDLLQQVNEALSAENTNSPLRADPPVPTAPAVLSAPPVMPVVPLISELPQAEAAAAVNRLIDEAIEALMKSDAARARGLIDLAETYRIPARDLFHLKGLCLIQEGQDQYAKQALEQELENFPDNGPAQELYRQLREQIKN